MVVVDIDGINNEDIVSEDFVPEDDNIIQTTTAADEDQTGAAMLRKVVQYWRDDCCVQFVDINTISCPHIDLTEAVSSILYVQRSSY